MALSQARSSAIAGGVGISASVAVVHAIIVSAGITVGLATGATVAVSGERDALGLQRLIAEHLVRRRGR